MKKPAQSILGLLMFSSTIGIGQGAIHHLLNPCINVFSCTPRLFPSPEEPDSVDFGLDSVWANKYVGEGIDLWNGSGIVGATARATYQGFTAKTWYGVSDNGSNYGELKFRGEYIKELEDWTIMPWFEQSFVFPGNKGIPRPGIKLTYHLNETYFTGTDFYWQHNNSVFRGYYSVFFGGQVQITDNIRFNSTIRYGYNGGYVGPGIGHGSNAIDYFNTLAYKFNDHFNMDIFANYAQALTTLRNAGKSGIFYYGINFHYDF